MLCQPCSAKDKTLVRYQGCSSCSCGTQHHVGCCVEVNSTPARLRVKDDLLYRAGQEKRLNLILSESSSIQHRVLLLFACKWSLRLSDHLDRTVHLRRSAV